MRGHRVPELLPAWVYHIKGADVEPGGVRHDGSIHNGLSSRTGPSVGGARAVLDRQC